MKAEHRKELQTNVLADRMGRLVQRIKERPKKRILLYVVLALIIVVGLFLFSRFRRTSALETSDRWAMIEESFQPEMNELIDKFPETNPGKAARFQYAWLYLWDLGLKNLAKAPVQVLTAVEDEIHDKNGKVTIGTLAYAERHFKELAKDCKDDSIWEPEVLYALAVIEEARAIRAKERTKHLTRAKELFQKLAKNHGNSARGKEAKKRAEALEKRAQEIADFYENLNDRLDVEREFERAKKKFKK
jgi:hypothetical protein